MRRMDYTNDAVQHDGGSYAKFLASPQLAVACQNMGSILGSSGASAPLEVPTPRCLLSRRNGWLSARRSRSRFQAVRRGDCLDSLHGDYGCCLSRACTTRSSLANCRNLVAHCRVHFCAVMLHHLNFNRV